MSEVHVVLHSRVTRHARGAIVYICEQQILLKKLPNLNVIYVLCKDTQNLFYITKHETNIAILRLPSNENAGNMY